MTRDKKPEKNPETHENSNEYQNAESWQLMVIAHSAACIGDSMSKYMIDRGSTSRKVDEDPPKTEAHSLCVMLPSLMTQNKSIGPDESLLSYAKTSRSLVSKATSALFWPSTFREGT